MLSAPCAISRFVLYRSKRLHHQLPVGPNNRWQDLRLHFSRLHRAVHRPDVAVDDPNLLRGVTAILLAALTDLNSLNEQAEQFWCELSMAVYCFAFSMNDSMLAADARNFSSRASFSGMAAANAFCSSL